MGPRPRTSQSLDRARSSRQQQQHELQEAPHRGGVRDGRRGQPRGAEWPGRAHFAPKPGAPGPFRPVDWADRAHPGRAQWAGAVIPVLGQKSSQKPADWAEKTFAPSARFGAKVIPKILPPGQPGRTDGRNCARFPGAIAPGAGKVRRPIAPEAGKRGGAIAPGAGANCARHFLYRRHFPGRTFLSAG